MNQTKYVGLDVHKSSISIAVLDAEGNLIIESTIKTDSLTLIDFFQGLTGAIHATFEEGCQAQWLFDILSPIVSKLIVCNPKKNHLLHSGNKGDKLDAKNLAHLLRSGSLKAVFHSCVSTKTLKERVRIYENLTEDLTRVMNRIKAIFRSRGISCSGRAPYQRSTREDWFLKVKDLGARARLDILYEEFDALKALRRRAKREMIAEARNHRAFRALIKVPTLGPVRVAQIIATVSSPHRFPTKRQFWTYCGLSVVTRSSADFALVNGGLIKKQRPVQTRGLTKDFNHRLKYVFKSAALDAIKRGEFKPYYEKLRERGLKAEIGRVQLARKIAAIVLSIFKSGEDFDEGRLRESA